jgi:hypothetical protein
MRLTRYYGANGKQRGLQTARSVNTRLAATLGCGRRGCYDLSQLTSSLLLIPSNRLMRKKFATEEGYHSD